MEKITYQEIYERTVERPFVVGKTKEYLVYAVAGRTTGKFGFVHAELIEDPKELTGKKIYDVIQTEEGYSYIAFKGGSVTAATIRDRKYESERFHLAAINILRAKKEKDLDRMYKEFEEAYEEFICCFDGETYIRNWIREQKMKRLLR